MPARHFSINRDSPSYLSAIDRRLSALSVEERRIDTPAEIDLSEVSTLAEQKASQHDDTASQSGPTLANDDASICSTPSTVSVASNHGDRPSIWRSDSNVMEYKRETKRQWAAYPQKGYQTTTKFFYEEIDGSWTAALIVVCFFVSGIVDSVSYQTFSVFTSLQTGNTVLMALRLSNQPASRHPFAYIKSATSVASYCLGGLFFNILHRVPTDLSNARPPLHRWTLFTSFITQSVLLVISAALTQSSWVSTQPFRSGTFSSGSSRNPDGNDNYLDLIPIAFLAFEAAGQVCLSRVLVVNELPTIVISTLYHDFIADALSWRKLWKTRTSTWGFVEGQKRQIRRLLCILALFAGAIVGGFVYASPGGIAAALWIASGAKIVVSVAWCLWKKRVLTETVVTKDVATKGSG